MARLTGSSIRAVQSNRLELATKMAKTWGQTVLLKGAYTIVRRAQRAVDGVALCQSSAGQSRLWGRSWRRYRWVTGPRAGPPFEAAVTGAYLHGLAGELARERLGVTAVVAGDLVAALPAAIREVAG